MPLGVFSATVPPRFSSRPFRGSPGLLFVAPRPTRVLVLPSLWRLASEMSRKHAESCWHQFCRSEVSKSGMRASFGAALVGSVVENGEETMQTNSLSQVNEADVEQLNSFLRGELAAVETYDQVLNRIEDSQIKQPLWEARASHGRRADLLRQRIVGLGGEPSSTSGVWGGFAKLVQGGAALFGVEPAIAALEEGEDHGRDDYRADLGELSDETQHFVSKTILPEQLRTHGVVSALKRQLKAS